MAESGVGEELLVYQERVNSKQRQPFTDLEIVKFISIFCIYHVILTLAFSTL